MLDDTEGYENNTSLVLQTVPGVSVALKNRSTVAFYDGASLRVLLIRACSEQLARKPRSTRWNRLQANAQNTEICFRVCLEPLLAHLTWQR